MSGYDWRDDWNRVQTRIGYDEDAHVDAMHRLAAHIEQLEAEHEATLVEQQRNRDSATFAHKVIGCQCDFTNRYALMRRQPLDNPNQK